MQKHGIALRSLFAAATSITVLTTAFWAMGHQVCDAHRREETQVRVGMEHPIQQGCDGFTFADAKRGALDWWQALPKTQDAIFARFSRDANDQWASATRLLGKDEKAVSGLTLQARR